MKRTLSLLPLLLLALNMSAAPVSEEQAKEFAQKFLNARHTKKKFLHSSASSELTVEALFEGRLYAVNRAGEGFVIVSGDDCCETVLGYADKGSFDLETAPVQVKAWLQDYVRQQEAVAVGRASAVKRMTGERAAIEPKLTTQWDQNAPYNNMCVRKGEDGTSSQCVTGCVAVAMAQVLKYHEWPEDPVPAMESYSYVEHYFENGHVVDKKFVISAPPSITFDWQNMRVSAYTGKEGEEQLNAVAQLIRYCGQSVHMQYGTDVSSAVSEEVPTALTKYFGFDESAHLVYRQNYTIDGWESLIYEELSQRGPVIYNGVSTGGGHSFILDGYDGEGYYHVNWGWGGRCDGYFLLTTMNPDSNVGIGASSTSDGYSIDQSAVVGVQKKDTDAENDHSAVEINGLTYKKGTYSMWFVNLTGQDVKIAFALVDEEGNIQKVLKPQELSNGNSMPHTVNESTILAGLPDGNYRLTGVSKAKYQQDWQLCEGQQFHFAELGVQNGTVATRILHPVMDCKLVTVENRGDGLSGHTQELDVTFTNTGTDDSYTTVDMYVEDSEEKEGSAGVSIPAGGSTCVRFSYLALQLGDVKLTFKSGDTLLGTHTIHIADSGADLNSWFATCRVDNMETMSDGVTNVLWSNDCSFTLEFINPTNQSMSKFLYVDVVVDNRDRYPISSKSPVPLAPRGRTSMSIVLGGMDKCNRLDITVMDGEMKELMAPLTIFSPHGGKAVNAAGYKTYVPSGSVVPEDATSVDFTYIENGVSGLWMTPSQNPNCLYFLTENASVPAWLIGKNVVCGTVCQDLSLTDGFDFRPKADFTATKASYTRTMPSKWGTIMLPYEVQSNGEIAYFQPKSIEDGMLHLTQLTTLPANTPALVAKVRGETITCQASEVEVNAVDGNSCEVDGIQLQGFYTKEHTVNAPNVYSLGNSNQFELNAATLVEAFRAYLTLDAETTCPNFLPVFDEFNSSLQDVLDGDATVEGYYDTTGRRIAHLQKGINLVRMSNGKTLKVMVE